MTCIAAGPPATDNRQPHRTSDEGARSGVAVGRLAAVADASSDPRQPEDRVNLSLVAIEKEGLVKLAASGSITAANFDPSGRNPLERILGQNWASFRVMLDMRQTTYIDSSAIGWLIGSHKAFKQQGGSMVLHDVPQGIRQMLDLLHVGRVVPMAANAQAARDLTLAPAPAPATTTDVPGGNAGGGMHP